MCGIVGYVGKQQAAPLLLDGLCRLEYRGYDSAGVAVCGAGGLQVRKTPGRLKASPQVGKFPTSREKCLYGASGASGGGH